MVKLISKRMKYFKIIFAIVLSISINPIFSQIEKFGFKKQVEESPNKKMPFAVLNEGQKTIESLWLNNINPKSITKEWIYITSTPKKIEEMILNKSISDFYFEFYSPIQLNDSTRVKHFVNEVHAGTNGLPLPFTGKDVIVGVIDAGLDINHPDFIDENGNSRVLFYWDQTLETFPLGVIPQPYDYGLEFTNQQIDNGALDALTFFTSHGTMSAGIVAGNGLANGQNKGMAPDSKIIFVNYGNSSLAISDACDYIFKKADALGLPCVINISVGSYLGSHDGNDAGSILVENLLNEKPGRIVSVSAGNSGAYAPYHVRGNVDSDTSFVWFENNAGVSPYLGTANTIIFDLYADQGDIQNVSYSFGANLPNGSFSERGTTIFRNALFSLGTPIRDTLRNAQGQQLGTIEVYSSLTNGVYNMTGIFSKVDSLSYYYSFKTKGNGKYDLWSSTGAGISLNKIVSVIPDVATFPKIIHYHAPDLEQSIVSGLACSEQIVTVGNVVNQTDYLNLLGNVVPLPAGFFSDIISPNSSRGPSRLNVMKPDVSATGDFSMAAYTLAELANPAAASKISSLGWHGRAGGTSASSPVVAGIGALFLERCKNASYADFMAELHLSSFSDQHTGAVPNISYGYGKIHALNLLKSRNYQTSLSGDNIICSTDEMITLESSALIDSIVWKFNTSSVTTTSSQSLNVSESGTYYSFAYDGQACVETDTITLTLGTILPNPVITVVEGVLTSTIQPNYQWYQNNHPIPGQTFQMLIGAINPNVAYTVAVTSPEGCVFFSNEHGINDLNEINFKVSVFPNPSNGEIQIEGIDNIEFIQVLDLSGKIILETRSKSTKIDTIKLKKGVYFIKIHTNNQILHTKFERL